MNSKQLNAITYNTTIGDSAFRLKAAEDAIPALQHDLNRLRGKAESQWREFAARLAAWTSRDVGETVRPVGIEQDLREARLINVIAVVLTVTELALTFFISLVFAVSAPFLLLVAVVSIFALKVGLLTLWRNDRQPQQTRRRLRRFVIAPSLAVTMLSLTALVFARTAGLFALLLLPFINLAICALSLGILGLSAGLFALGFLMSWSRHAEKRFNAVEREAVETRRVLQQAERVAEELRARRSGGTAAHAPSISAAGSSPASLPAQPAQPPRITASLTPQQTASRRNGSLLTVLALAAALWGGGCKIPGEAAQGGTSAPPPQAQQQAGTPSPAPATDSATMEIWLDWSLSAEDGPFREAARALLAALPELAAKHRITRVAAYQFGDRGWSAAEIFSLDLPAPETAKLGEAGEIFKGMKKEQEGQVNQQHLSRLREKLAAITPERLLPTQAVEPPCTDLRGALVRICETRLPQRRLVFLITDGADTCSRQLQTVSPAAADAALVVVILPEAPPANAQQTKVAQRAAQQRPDVALIQRRTEFQQAAPGAVVIPHFGNQIGAAEEAMAKLGKQPNQ